MKKIERLFAVIGLLAVVVVAINAVQKPDTLVTTFDPGRILNVYALPVPQGLNFVGEPVPIHNPDIKERIDRELLVNTYWQSNALLLMKRANKYFPLIEPILAAEGVPDDFKYLAVIESGLTQAVSPARATGFWQIMKGTGKEYGLEINDNVDERYHIEKSTRVACEYLKKAKARFGSWTAAAAAYNAGPAGISNRMKSQNVNDYYDLLLNQETGRYVFRIIALKEIMSNPTKYGFNFTPNDLYTTIPTYKVAVDTAVTDFAKFAEKYGINYKVLKIHNPWLRENHLNNASRKQYFIDIPKQGYYAVGR